MGEYDRAQLLAASSIARFLAAELEHASELEEVLMGDLASLTSDAKAVGLPERVANSLTNLSSMLNASAWSDNIGTAVCELMSDLHKVDDAGAEQVGNQLRAVLRRHTDLEVERFALSRKTGLLESEG